MQTRELTKELKVNHLVLVRTQSVKPLKVLIDFLARKFQKPTEHICIYGV